MGNQKIEVESVSTGAKSTITIPNQFKPGDLIIIKTIDGLYYGSIINNYLKKFKGTNAYVIKYLNTETRQVLIQPLGYKNYLRVNEDEIKTERR